MPLFFFLPKPCVRLGRGAVRQSAESVLASIDIVKQSILARAFHGDLCTSVVEKGSAEVYN